MQEPTSMFWVVWKYFNRGRFVGCIWLCSLDCSFFCLQIKVVPQFEQTHEEVCQVWWEKSWWVKCEHVWDHSGNIRKGMRESLNLFNVTEDVTLAWEKRYKKSCVGLCITCQPTGDWRIFSDFFQKNFVNVWNFLFALDKLENFNHGLDTLVVNVCFKEFDCRI